MSNVARVYNIFSQIDEIYKKTQKYGVDLLMEVFKCETIEDLYYIKPYIYGEIEFYKNERLEKGVPTNHINDTVNPFINFLNTCLLINMNLKITGSSGYNDTSYKNEMLGRCKTASFITSLYFITNSAFDNPIKNAEEDIAKIKKEVEELRQGIQLNIENKPENSNTYVRTFILQNLDRIDLLLNNYDKIRPHYIKLPLYSVLGSLSNHNSDTCLEEDMKRVVYKVYRRIKVFIDVYMYGTTAKEAISEIVKWGSNFLPQ